MNKYDDQHWINDEDEEALLCAPGLTTMESLTYEPIWQGCKNISEVARSGWHRLLSSPSLTSKISFIQEPSLQTDELSRSIMRTALEVYRRRLANPQKVLPIVVRENDESEPQYCGFYVPMVLSNRDKVWEDFIHFPNKLSRTEFERGLKQWLASLPIYSLELLSDSFLAEYSMAAESFTE